MNPAKLLKSTVSTTSAFENTGMQMYGNTSQIYSITSPLPPSSTTKSSASMEVYPQVLIPSIISEPSIVFKRSHMKVPCAICYGRTQTTDVDGVYHLEAPGIRLDRTFPKRSTTIMV
jgi:hypothetical protein